MKGILTMKMPPFAFGFFPIFLFCLMLFYSCTAGPKKGAVLTEEEKIQEDRLLDSISTEKLLNYVKHLSGRAYAGRLTGTPEYTASAKWMSSKFEEWGLEPAGDNGTYLQSYPNPYAIVFVGGELSYNYRSKGQSRKKKYVYEKEYYPGSQSGDGSLTAEVVYAGYGIYAPELNYNDYAEVNVKGKIVLIEPGAPVSPEANSGHIEDWKPYASSRYKLKIAVAQGAKGMLINDLTVNPDIDYVQNFMVAQVGESVIKDIFTGTGKTHGEVKAEITNTQKHLSFRTGKVFTIENFTEHHPKGTGYNVLGLIRGKDPLLKNEATILGANLDHVGFCYEIMPGANDNASGIAVLLGVAEALAKSPVRAKRSVLFIGFGSKEQGFRGTQTYLKNPLFSKNKSVVFLNLNMVGCGDQLRTMGGQDYPKIWGYILGAMEKTGQHSIEPLPYSNPGLPESDADLFLDKGIPSMTFRAYGAPTFPRTTKDTANTITPEIMTKLSKILYRSILAMANTNQDFFKE